MSDGIEIIRFAKSPLPKKKYRAFLSNGRHVDFGALPYEQYKDKTPLKLYSYLDHHDKIRRANYYRRHSVDYPKYSADWFSKHYLW